MQPNKPTHTHSSRPPPLRLGARPSTAGKSQASKLAIMKQYGVKPHISIISRLSPSSVTARGVSRILPLPMQAMAFFSFLPDHAVRQIPPSIGGTAGGNAVGLVGWPVSQDRVGACAVMLAMGGLHVETTNGPSGGKPSRTRSHHSPDTGNRPVLSSGTCQWCCLCRVKARRGCQASRLGEA